jgi:hypothetical protein
MCSHTSSHSARQVVSGCLQVIGTRSVDRSGFGPQGPGKAGKAGLSGCSNRGIEPRRNWHATVSKSIVWWFVF